MIEAVLEPLGEASYIELDSWKIVIFDGNTRECYTMVSDKVGCTVEANGTIYAEDRSIFGSCERRHYKGFFKRLFSDYAWDLYKDSTLCGTLEAKSLIFSLVAEALPKIDVDIRYIDDFYKKYNSKEYGFSWEISDCFQLPRRALVSVDSHDKIIPILFLVWKFAVKYWANR